MNIVSPADADDRLAVLSLLNDGAADSEGRSAEMLDSARRGELSLDGLLAAREGENGPPIGALLYVIQPDGTALLWPPRTVCSEPREARGSEAGAERDAAAVTSPPGSPPRVAAGRSADEIANALLREALGRLDAQDIWLTQCLLAPGDSAPESRALARNGFAHLADLLYLHRAMSDPLPPRPDVGFETVTFRPSSPSSRARFAEVIEQTYVDTLDCPDFQNLRTAEHALESHKSSGCFDPARWKIYTVGGEDVGVLLMNAHPEPDAWEVVYMGVVPSARGRGYGRAMLLSGLYEAQDVGPAWVVLAVDSKNGYANSIYSDLGFSEMTRRSVHIRSGR